mmetsp:Transcript_4193/g.9208  ORF Transcript_4193/g.9208 Transcript_4193/m.9208 type:complete len:115 (+) Transcript_4193:184-528(+)
MTLSGTSTRKHNSRFFPQTSRVDWGDASLRNLARSLKSSFTWSKTFGTGGGDDGSSMKSAAAAAARSLEEGFPAGKFYMQQFIAFELSALVSVLSFVVCFFYLCLCYFLYHRTH